MTVAMGLRDREVRKGILDEETVSATQFPTLKAQGTESETRVMDTMLQACDDTSSVSRLTRESLAGISPRQLLHFWDRSRRLHSATKKKNTFFESYYLKILG